MWEFKDITKQLHYFSSVEGAGLLTQGLRERNDELGASLGNLTKCDNLHILSDPSFMLIGSSGFSGGEEMTQIIFLYRTSQPQQIFLAEDF